MKLYEISENYKNLVELLEKSENGEFDFKIDNKAIRESIEEVESDLNDKLLNTGKLLKNYNADIAALDEEIKRLTEKKRSKKRNVDNLKEYVKECMESAGIKKADLNVIKFSIRKTPGKLIIASEDEIPAEYTFTTVEYFKEKMKEDLKAGKEVPGVLLETGTSLSMK